MSKIAKLEPFPASQRGELERWRLGQLFAFCPTQDGEGAVVFLGCQGIIGEGEGLVKVRAKPPALPRLEAVTADKALYREGDDTVRLLAWVPQAAGDAAPLKLTLNGNALTTVQVDINEQGLGLFTMRDPLAGEYTAALGGSKATFTVAGYKLAPLTALLSSSRIETNDAGKDALHFAISAESYGAALNGPAKVSLVDLGRSPPAVVTTTSMSFSEGRISGTFLLSSAGPFAIQIQSKKDAAKTATVPLPGTSQAERSEVVLSSWGEQTFARGVAFEGSSPLRGLFVGTRPLKTAAPLRLVSVTADSARLQARAELDSWRVVVMDPHTGVYQQHAGTALPAGATVEVPLSGDWCWLTAGAITLGRCWEGSAAVLLPDDTSLSVDVPSRAEPGTTVMVALSGQPGASAYVLVKDARLQTADTPTSAAGASRRRQLEAATALGADADVVRSLASLLPRPRPPMMPMRNPAGMPMAGGGNVQFSVGSAAPMSAVRSSRPRMKSAPEATLDTAPLQEGPAREDFPEVVFAALVSLDERGHATVPVTLGDAMGTMVVEAFAAHRAHHAAAQTEILVSREVFGELVLPRFVAAGDHAEGRLYVRLREGHAQVEVRHDGVVVVTKTLSAPGDTVAFPASAGDWEAVVRGAVVDRSRGRVDRPGKLVWLQCATRILSAGEAIARGDVDGALSLRVMPSLEESLQGMIGGLRSYAHCCCEQTSSVLLAASAAWLTAGDAAVRQDAVDHIRSCVDRMASMHLPGKGFKGWPSYPPEVFVYSPGATLNLLQLEMFDGLDMPPLLREALDRASAMARDAAAAHQLDPAPAEPKSAREAYGRFSKFVADRQRMAAFIRDRIEPWDKEMMAILKFELPAMSTETYRRSPAMIRCETAFGAAALLSTGSTTLVKQGLSLANTVLGAVQENGSLYSTLDSVAAITMLTTMIREGLGGGGRCRIGGESLSIGEAAQLGAVEAVEVLEGTAQIEIQRLISEDYTALQQGIKAAVWLEKDRRRVKQVAPGDDLEIVINIQSGYQAGDLVHVFLPDALSWVHGGGQVKKFSIDLEGQDTLRVPLAATGVTLDATGQKAPQHFAVCIRNMYDEERGAGFGDLSVVVSPDAGDDGLLGRMLSGLRELIS
jgi:hypothetical protein